MCLSVREKIQGKKSEKRVQEVKSIDQFLGRLLASEIKTRIIQDAPLWLQYTKAALINSNGQQNLLPWSRWRGDGVGAEPSWKQSGWMEKLWGE